MLVLVLGLGLELLRRPALRDVDPPAQRRAALVPPRHGLLKLLALVVGHRGGRALVEHRVLGELPAEALVSEVAAAALVVLVRVRVRVRVRLRALTNPNPTN